MRGLEEGRRELGLCLGGVAWAGGLEVGVKCGLDRSAVNGIVDSPIHVLSPFVVRRGVRVEPEEEALVWLVKQRGECVLVEEVVVVFAQRFESAVSKDVTDLGFGVFPDGGCLPVFLVEFLFAVGGTSLGP